MFVFYINFEFRSTKTNKYFFNQLANMTIIYTDSQILDLEWVPYISLPNDYVKTSSLDEYLESTDTNKIAFTTHRLHCDSDSYMTFEKKISQLTQNSRLVFSFESELHNHHWQLFRKVYSPNLFWCLPGQVNDNDPMAHHILPWQDWFKTTSKIYQNLPQVVDRFRPYEVKPKMFDALLGVVKPHRSFAYTKIKNSELNDLTIMTYGGTWKDDDFYAKDYFIWESEGVEPLQKIIGTADHVDYLGQYAHLSQVIPIDVYNQTAYTVVAETDHDNTLSCFTEKIVKPMIARRLFVVFSGYRYLANLRASGIQTFGSIIDESYDLVKNDEERYSMVIEQMKWLAKQPQEEIFERIKPIVEHNYNLVMNKDWIRFAIDHIDNVIANFDNIKLSPTFRHPFVN